MLWLTQRIFLNYQLKEGKGRWGKKNRRFVAQRSSSNLVLHNLSRFFLCFVLCVCLFVFFFGGREGYVKENAPGIATRSTKVREAQSALSVRPPAPEQRSPLAPVELSTFNPQIGSGSRIFEGGVANLPEWYRNSRRQTCLSDSQLFPFPNFKLSRPQGGGASHPIYSPLDPPLARDWVRVRLSNFNPSTFPEPFVLHVAADQQGSKALRTI